jgi:hypothetical protein
MATMTDLTLKALSYHELHKQFWNCEVGITDLSMGKPGLEKIVIRCEDGDYELCAIHRQGNLLIFDKGHKVDEAS